MAAFHGIQTLGSKLPHNWHSNPLLSDESFDGLSRNVWSNGHSKAWTRLFLPE
jgi:hypothetical protein